MKIDKLQLNPNIYSSNVYLIRGDWNKIDDVNALIDAGNDPNIVNVIKNYNTGVGKKSVDKIILTHSHFDHIHAAKILKEHYKCEIYSYSKLDITDHKVFNNQLIKLGDTNCYIFHTPGHSSDSISIYCPDNLSIFTGDLPFIINSIGGTYTDEHIYSIKTILSLNIKTIYPGHGDPITGNIKQILNETYNNMIKSNNMIKNAK
jgi:glyoxylase-like metal-dependent hydrolase (beta-lactamase superfamily II)